MTTATHPVEAPGAITATQPVEAPGVIVVTQPTGQATNKQHATVRPEVQPPDPIGQTVTAKKSRFTLSLTGTAHPAEQDSDDDNFKWTPTLAVISKKMARSLIGNLSDRNQITVFRVVTRRSATNSTIETIR